MGAIRAHFQILIQFLVENHFFALGTFGPQPLGDVALASGAGAHRVFFDCRLLLDGGRSHCRFDRFESEVFFVLISHNDSIVAVGEYVG